MDLDRQIDRAEWMPFFDRLVTDERLEATMEVVSEELGDQTEATRVPLDSVSYDERDDSITIAVGGRGRLPVVLWHTIDRPRSVWVHEHDGGIDAMLVEAADGARTLLRLQPEPPRAAASA